MRLISFRVFNLSQGYMDRVKSIEFDDNGDPGIITTGNRGPVSAIECMLMQSTGMYDCKNKEVYEGDIIKYETGVGGWGQLVDAVVFDKGQWCVQPSGNRISSNGRFRYALSRLTPGRDWYDQDEGAWMEVVGNVYENPEMLEVDK